MSFTASCQNLYEQFQQAIADPNYRSHYKETWRLIVGHPWYWAQLREISRQVARYGVDSVLHEDVRQEAVFLLARTLERHPDLNYDRNQPEETFSHWMRKIIFRDCRQAARQLRRGFQIIQLDESDLFFDPQDQTESKLELEFCLDALPPTERIILDGCLGRRSLEEIAVQLALSPATVHRRLRRAMEKLRQFAH